MKTRIAALGAGYLSLCVLCCAIPALLIALGLIGATTAAYLSSGFVTAMIVLALIGLGYLVITYVRQQREKGGS